MILVLKLIGVILGFFFPVFLIKAMSAWQEDKSSSSKYMALSSVSFGLLIVIIMGLLPNS